MESLMTFDIKEFMQEIITWSLLLMIAIRMGFFIVDMVDEIIRHKE